MHLLLLLLLAQTPDEKAALATVQKVFDGIAAHDSALISSTMLPDARIYSSRDSAAPTSVPAADLSSRIAATKIPLLERFTALPFVLIRGNMAQVWGDYEFFRDNQFSHCGVDTATLFKTSDGTWKIASLTYTVETAGCKPSK